jgi:hypothetical protein
MASSSYRKTVAFAGEEEDGGGVGLGFLGRSGPPLMHSLIGMYGLSYSFRE